MTSARRYRRRHAVRALLLIGCYWAFIVAGVLCALHGGITP